MTLLLTHALLTAALYYLAARAEITRPIWSWYPRWLDRLAMCPACSGFWLGGAVAAAGAVFHVAHSWAAVPIGALTGVVTTPILWGAMAYGLTAGPDVKIEDKEPPPQ